jgi:hypothetical protein
MSEVYETQYAVASTEQGRSRVAPSFMGSHIEDVDDGGHKLSFDDSSIRQCLSEGISLGIEDQALVFFFFFLFSRSFCE